MRFLRFIIIIFGLVFSGFNDLKAQKDLGQYLDSLSQNNDHYSSGDTSNKYDPSWKPPVKNKIRLSVSDSIKAAFLKDQENIRYRNDKPVTFFYPLKLDAGGNTPQLTKDMQQGFPLTLSFHHSEDGMFFHAEVSALLYLGWGLATYPGDPSSSRFNVANQFITGGLGYMFATRPDHKERIGPGFFWGSIIHNDGFGPVTMTLGTSICYQMMTKNERPVRFQYDFGKGLIEDEFKRDRLKGVFWEFNAHFPFAFGKLRSEVNINLNPYVLYCKVPYYSSNIYYYTPSTFLIGCRIGVAIHQ